METAIGVEAASLGDNQNSNQNINSERTQSFVNTDTKLSFSSGDFLLHETGISNSSNFSPTSSTQINEPEPIGDISSNLLEHESINSPEKLVISSANNSTDSNKLNERVSEKDEIEECPSAPAESSDYVEILPGSATSERFEDKTISVIGDIKPNNEDVNNSSVPNEPETVASVDPQIPSENNRPSENIVSNEPSDTIVPVQKINEEPETKDVPHVKDSDDLAEMLVETKNNEPDSHTSELNNAPNTEESVEASLQPPASDSSPSDEWLDILGSGHLMKKVLKAGVPDSRPLKSDVCILSYYGCLEDGTVVDKAEEVKVQINDNEVIQGIDFALALMDKGEEAEIKVSSRFAYGSLGRKPDIPPGATLLYNVKLLDVQEEPPISTLSVDNRILMGLQKKEKGNWWYSRGDNSLAINCYRRALEYFDDTEIPEPHSEETVHKLLEEKLKTYNNLAASQMKINAFDAALMSLNNVLSSQPKNVKALYRKSKILQEKGELQEAINTVRLALSYDKDLPILQQQLSELQAAQRKVNSKQRELYKKMMGNNPNKEKEPKSQKSNYNTLKWVTAISFVVAVLGTVAVKFSK